jgi:hypothetical protein
MQLVSENRPTAPTAALIITATAVTIMQMTAGEVVFILGAVGAMAKKFGGQLPFWPNQWARGQ